MHHYLCQLWVAEDAGHEEIKNTEDEGDHHGEEGHAHQHTHQAQASDKQQEPWRRRATGGWLPPPPKEVKHEGGMERRRHPPWKKTKPTAEMMKVTTAKVRKSPTGSTAKAANSSRV